MSGDDITQNEKIKEVEKLGNDLQSLNLEKQFSSVEELNLQYDEVLKEVAKLTANKDPETKPFTSKYNAIAKLKSFQEKLRKYKDEVELPVAISVIIEDKIAILESKMGVLHFDTEDVPSAESSLMKSLETLQNRALVNPVEIIIVYNHLGIIWSNRNDFQKSEKFLQLAESLYKDWRKSYYPDAPNSIILPTQYTLNAESLTQQLEEVSAIRTDEPVAIAIEMQHTLTYFYLAQLCRHQNKLDQSALYCAITLERQLKMKIYEPIDWSINVVELSGYFNSQNSWILSCKCLIAAEKIMDLSNPQDSGTARGIIAVGWSKFYLERLLHAKLILSEGKPSEKDLVNIGEDVNNMFDGLFQEQEPALEELKKFRSITTYEQAKFIFQKGIDKCNKAKEHFPLDGSVTDHINILLDISAFWLVLTFFEKDPSTKCKMHKRRAKLVENILKDLNPQYFLNSIQQISFQLGVIYNQIFEIKRDQVEKLEVIPASKAKKLNSLIAKAIYYFRYFLKTYEVKGKAPEKIGESSLENYITSRVSIARLLSRAVNIAPDTMIKNLNESIQEYKWVLDYAKANSITILKDEIEMCKEMANLLPKQIEKIRRGQ